MKYITSLFILFAFLLSSCGSKQTEVIEDPLRPVRFAKISNNQSLGQTTFSGAAKSSKTSNLSFKVNGKIDQIKVKVGDLVRRNQLIAVLDPTDYNIQLDEAIAQLRSAETQVKSSDTQLNNAKSTYLRIERLYENNSVSLSEYEGAKTNYEAAQSSSEAAKAQVALAQKQVQAGRNQVNYTRLTAPYQGIITQVLVEENELVSTGAPIVNISSDASIEVEVGVPESFIGRVGKGQQVQVSYSAIKDKFFNGTVEEVGYSTAGGATYPVTIRCGKADDQIRPGMAARVTFQDGDQTLTKENSPLLAPVKSIGQDQNGHFVFVLNNDGNHYKVEKRPVKIGILKNNGFTIQSGLKSGEMVATAGLSTLLDGMDVTLLEE